MISWDTTEITNEYSKILLTTLLALNKHFTRFIGDYRYSFCYHQYASFNLRIQSRVRMIFPLSKVASHATFNCLLEIVTKINGTNMFARMQIDNRSKKKLNLA